MARTPRSVKVGQPHAVRHLVDKDTRTVNHVGHLRMKPFGTAVKPRNAQAVAHLDTLVTGLGPERAVCPPLVLSETRKDDTYQLHIAVLIIVVDVPVAHLALGQLHRILAECREQVVGPRSLLSAIVRHGVRQRHRTHHVKLRREPPIAAGAKIPPHAGNVHLVLVAQILQRVSIQVLVEGTHRVVYRKPHILEGSQYGQYARTARMLQIPTVAQQRLRGTTAAHSHGRHAHIRRDRHRAVSQPHRHHTAKGRSRQRMPTQQHHCQEQNHLLHCRHQLCYGCKITK